MVSGSRTHGREDRKQFPLDSELIAASCYKEERKWWASRSKQLPCGETGMLTYICVLAEYNPKLWPKITSPAEDGDINTQTSAEAPACLWTRP